jgi:two-component system, LytTR family, response regulator LytT
MPVIMCAKTNVLISETRNLPFELRPPVTGALLVYHKSKIIPVKIAHIALFDVFYKSTRLTAFDGRQYSVRQSLDELERICGSLFYRAGRQQLISREAVLEVQRITARKLEVLLKVEGVPPVIIGKNKTQHFLHWLSA